jgi:tRNA(fMet)-specific endonuclease VapC
VPLYLLNTSVCVEILRGRVGRALPRTMDCCLSTIVTAELWTGVERNPTNIVQREMLEDFLSLFRVVAFDTEAATHYGRIRADLEGRGQSIGPMDLLIAAHARSMEATLITGNANEFRRVAGLHVISWRSTHSRR